MPLGPTHPTSPLKVHTPLEQIFLFKLTPFCEVHFPINTVLGRFSMMISVYVQDDLIVSNSYGALVE